MGLVEEDTLRNYARVDERFLGDVSKFLNRILGLPAAKQNLVSSCGKLCHVFFFQSST